MAGSGLSGLQDRDYPLASQTGSYKKKKKSIKYLDLMCPKLFVTWIFISKKYTYLKASNIFLSFMVLFYVIL